MSNHQDTPIAKKTALISIFLVVLLSLIRLGFWQLHRAETKRQLLAQNQLLSQQKALDIGVLKKAQIKNFLPVHLHGHWLEKGSFFLDNRVLDGKLGYNQFALFSDHSGKIVWVDRGWTGFMHKRSFSKIATSKGQLNLVGKIYFPEPYKVVALPQLSVDKQQILPGLNLAVMLPQLNKQGLKVEPYIVRQTFPDNNPRLIKKWLVTNFPPQRHIGYAIQWFLMAFAFIIASVVFYYKKIKVNDES